MSSRPASTRSATCTGLLSWNELARMSIFGVRGLKTHAKTALVVRQEPSGLRSYAHIGTGNYHVRTARLYTDVGLFTCDPALTRDVVNLFHYLTGHSQAPDCDQLLVAPSTMRVRFLELIKREMDNQTGRAPGPHCGQDEPARGPRDHRGAL